MRCGSGSPTTSLASPSGTSITSPWIRTHRGTGLGAALIRHGLDFADRDGVPAFLETARPGNVAYYERRGFRTIAEGDAPGGGPHLWFMRYDS